MRRYTTTSSSLVISTLGALALAASVSAARADDDRGTAEEQLACTPDVFRLCGSEIPDTTRIVACLRSNRLQLGSACRAVFDAHATMERTDTTQHPPNAPRKTAPTGPMRTTPQPPATAGQPRP